MIKVSNGYIVGWDAGHYIGRAGKGKKGSALANPFKLADTSNSEERDRVIAKYRRWLWQKIQEKDAAVMAELFYLKEQAIANELNLLCFCKQPTREVACHGDVIKSCLEWMIK
ncbi:DUF4326 domain-containing protein [Chlorogloea sp. CCALA 695]|uniref:DUF4326 domain-containing protein n=1 Tax=Chlorogloea sp. CCALA 695 TaxID=2107693 RepID=UPI000D059EF0|nr:DUF4326 domain-containing protein [Chlorogloea sp. CCALA 695]PSB29605.1 hypothetical protein C7B70_18120 [Chlorogloea sp. CCALA 695]